VSNVTNIKAGGKKPPMPSSRKGQLLAKLNGMYTRGYSDGINFLGAELGKPNGVLMKDGRIARIVYEPAPEQPAPFAPDEAQKAANLAANAELEFSGTPGGDVIV
jgi:hypothetical protein